MSPKTQNPSNPQLKEAPQTNQNKGKLPTDFQVPCYYLFFFETCNWWQEM